MSRSVLALLLILAMGAPGGGPVRATELHPIRNSPRYRGDAREVARAFLEDRANQYALHDVELEYRHTLALGDFRTVRFVQRHGDLPVLGTAAAVRVSPDGRVTVVVLRVARELLLSTEPRVTPDEVRTLLHSYVGPWAAAGRLTFRLAVLPEPRGPGLLVWQVDVPNGQGGLRLLIDAHRPVVLHVRSLAVRTLGRVYPISSVVTPDVTDLELVDLDDASPLVLTGWNGQLIVTNYASGSTQSDILAEQTLNPNSGEDFLYDPPTDPSDPTDGFAQVALYYHLTRIRGFFADTLGVDFSPAGWQLAAVANMMEDGQPLDNAFFTELGLGAPFHTPNLIAVGQGTGLDFADDSDVFLHEFTHYVSHMAVGYNMGQGGADSYGMSTFSGSIDEGMADYFACTENGDPLLGEASLVLYGSGRDLTDTSKVCPDDIYGEVHMDGEIIGSLAWTMRETFGKTSSDLLIWGTMSLLVPYASIGDFSMALVQTANDLVAQGMLTAQDVQTVRDTIDGRGLTDCYAELSIAQGQPRLTNMFGLDLIGMFMGGDCQDMRGIGFQGQSLFHFRATPGPDDEGIRLSVTLTPDGGNDLLWGIYGRAGEHVQYAVMGYFPSVVAYDYIASWFDGTTGEIVIDADSDPPFDPSQTYHFVITHQNCPSTQAVVTVEPVTASPEPDGGVDGDALVTDDASGGEPAPPGRGCNCRTGTTGSSTLWLLLLLGLIFILTRAGRSS